MTEEARDIDLILNQPAVYAYGLLKTLNDELLKLERAHRFTLILGDLSFFDRHKQCFTIDVDGALEILHEIFVQHKFPVEEWLDDNSSCQQRLRKMYFDKEEKIVERKTIKKINSVPDGKLVDFISNLPLKQDIQLASLYTHYCRDNNALVFSQSIWDAYVRLSKFCRINYNEVRFENLSYSDYCKSISGLIKNIKDEAHDKSGYTIGNDILQHILIMIAPVASLDFVSDGELWDINTSIYYRDNHKEIYSPIVDLYKRINSDL